MKGPGMGGYSGSFYTKIAIFSYKCKLLKRLIQKEYQT
jgi:hypothetical protein